MEKDQVQFFTTEEPTCYNTVGKGGTGRKSTGMPPVQPTNTNIFSHMEEAGTFQEGTQRSLFSKGSFETVQARGHVSRTKKEYRVSPQ